MSRGSASRLRVEVCVLDACVGGSYGDGNGAPMSHDVEKWFSDPKCGDDWQDMDLVLDDIDYLPRLTAYLDKADAPEFKKVEVISALLELLEHDCPRDGGPEATRVAGEIRITIRRHGDV